MSDPAAVPFHSERSDKEVLDPGTFFRIQEMFGKAAPMAVSTFDNLSLQICPSSNINPLCAEFLKMRGTHPDVAKKCIDEHFPHLKQALETGKKVRYRCWLGFENTAIPLMVNGKSVGVLAAGQVKTRPPNPGDFEVLTMHGLDPETYYRKARELEEVPLEKYEQWIELLSTVANAVAADRSRQIEDARRARRLQFISDLSRHIGEDVGQLLSFIVNAMPQACELEKCTLLLLDEKREALVAKASNAYTPDELKNFSIPMKGGKGKLQVEPEPFVSSDAPRDPRLMKEHVKKSGIKSLLTIPLKVREKVMGVIHFANFDSYHYFTQEEVHQIHILASEVALAVESTLLHEERRVREEEMNRFRAEVQGYFAQIGRAVSSALNIENLLHLIADLSMRVVKADGAAVYLRAGDALKQEMSLGEIPHSEKTSIPYRDDHAMASFGEVEILNLDENGGGMSVRIPLKTQEEIIGLLTLYLKHERDFSTEEQDVVTAFAAQATLSIKNIRLFQAEQEKAREMAVVYEAAKAISAPIDLDQILDETAKRMCAIAEVNRCMIFLLDAERKILSTAMVHGTNAEQKDFFSAMAIPLNFLEGTVSQHFRQGRPVVLRADELSNTDSLRNLFSLFGTKACLLAPLLSERKLTGLVYLDDTEIFHPFTEGQVRSIMSLSLHAATSVERAQLFKQSEDQAKQVHTLYQISTALSTTLNLDRILSLIVEKTTQLVKADRFCLFMWDDDKNVFTVTASHGLSDDFIDKAIVRIEDRFVGLASYRKKPIYSANVLLETDNPQLARLFKKEGLGAVLAVPLVTKRKTIGVITLFAELGYQFKEKEIHLLGNFASHAALSIENAKLYNMNKQKVQELGILFDVGKRISMHLNPQDVLRSMAEQFLWVMKADGCSVMLIDKNERTMSIQVTRGITRRSNLQKKIKIGQGIVGEVARTGQSAVIQDEGKDAGPNAFPKSLRDEGIQTILSVPLATKEDIAGVVNLYTKEKKDYSLSEMHLMNTLAGQAAVALQNAQIFEEHYHVAQLIQRSLLPGRVPAVKEIEVGFQYLPSQEISGDYYDFLEMRGKLGITVADVSGKGTGAAIFTAQGKYAWKAYGLLEEDPQKVLTLLNRLMVENTPTEKFISMFYGVLDYRKKEFTYANAGHLPPFLYRPGAKDCKQLSAPGLLLGIDSDVDFGKKSISLSTGDILLFYTDGVTEARGEGGEIFGMERLEKAFSDNVHHSAQVIANRILATVRSFTRKRSLDDDITIVVVKIR